MSAPVDLATVLLLDFATALGAVAAVMGIEALHGTRRPPSPPEPPLPPPAATRRGWSPRWRQSFSA